MAAWPEITEPAVDRELCDVPRMANEDEPIVRRQVFDDCFDHRPA
jgi:hypothetical protein